MSRYQTRVAIIGHGTIGRALHERMLNERCEVVGVATSKGYFKGDPGALEPIERPTMHTAFGRVDLAFVAIPTLDDGAVALRYMSHFLQQHVPTVTCEKGALANHFEELRYSIKQNKVGYSATVGGGSGMIDFLRSRFSVRTQEVHVILNGTLNYIWTGLREGFQLKQVVGSAKELGIIEPGETDPLRIILGEARSDATKKAAILYNLCFNPAGRMKAGSIAVGLSESDVLRALTEANDRRFVVSFQRPQLLKQKRAETEDIVAFVHEDHEWRITGAFKDLSEYTALHPVTRLCDAVKEMQNGIIAVEGTDGNDGTYMCIGNGAGPGPTTAAMLRDAERLLGPW